MALQASNSVAPPVDALEAAASRSLILLDGSSYLRRAFYALPPMTSTRATPVGAVYGVTNMLLKLVRDYTFHYIAIVFDGAAPWLRDHIRQSYQASRRPIPEDLKAQVDPLIQVIEAMGLCVFKIDGQEADDVIASLMAQSLARRFATTVSTCGKTMAQLASQPITLINSMTGEVLDRDAVKLKFSVYPEQIVDYLALIGDGADDIPGIDTVGARTALKWFDEFGTLDNIIAGANTIKGKTGGRLLENLQSAELSKKLAQVYTDLRVELDPDRYRPKPPDRSRLRELYAHLGFSTLLEELTTEPSPRPVFTADNGSERETLLSLHRPLPALVKARTLPKQEDNTPAPVERHYEIVFDLTHLEQWIERLQNASLFAFDTETTSLNYMDAELVGLSFCAEPGHAAYVPVAHRYAGAPPQLDRATVLRKLKPLLEDPLRSKVGHHLKYDAHVLSNHGIELNGGHYDSMIESYVLNGNGIRHDMDSLAQQYLNVKTMTFQELCGKGKRQITFDYVQIERAGAYAAEDADITLQLHLTLWAKLSRIPSLKALYEQIEQPLASVMKRMEDHGVLVDCTMLKSQSAQVTARMVEITRQAHVEAGCAFNLASPKQLRELLFDKLNLPILHKTPTGHPSTSEKVLEELALTFTLPRLVSEYRHLAKLTSTYLDRLPQQVNARTGRLHTSYHNAVAATGRLTSTKPNLQSIPAKDLDGRRIRKAFIVAPHALLVAADYSQIELRIMAHLSGDERLVHAFANDLDIHRATAAEVFGIPAAQVTADQRRSAKAVNFGLIYGISAYGLARQLGIDKEAAQEYIDLYFEHYPGIKRCIDDIRAVARKKGYVETVYGRRVHLPNICSRFKGLRMYSERCAVNAPMQGTAADIIKRAMISIDRWIHLERIPAKLIMQVHDELVFEVLRTEAPLFAEGVRERMQNAANLSIPLKVDIGIGFNWDEAH